MGQIRIDRAYYYCNACHAGFSPSDEALHLGKTDQTPGTEEVVAFTGSLDSFATAANKVLVKLTGLRLSESTVERTTEAVGERLGKVLESRKTIGPAKPWGWHRDAEGKTCAYISADATGVPQQGIKGSKAECRMANVVMAYNPVPEEKERWSNPDAKRRPEQTARYLAGFASIPQQLEQLRVIGAQIGMDSADRWIALSDGGAGLEAALRSSFPRVEAVILDFWHAAEHVHDFAKVWDPGKAELGEEWCRKMKKEGGQAMLETIRALPTEGKDAAVQESHRELKVYLENQQHRMDYPTYKQKGWQIGSGSVESACKGVVGQRLKGPGMRWGLAGSDAVCHLRALLCSADNHWDAFWRTSA